jgi:hypothetical protein
MIVASAANERVIFSTTNRFVPGSAEVKLEKTSPFFEIAFVLVRLDHVPCTIVNTDHGIM